MVGSGQIEWAREAVQRAPGVVEAWEACWSALDVSEDAALWLAQHAGADFAACVATADAAAEAKARLGAVLDRPPLPDWEGIGVDRVPTRSPAETEAPAVVARALAGLGHDILGALDRLDLEDEDREGVLASLYVTAAALQLVRCVEAGP